MKQLFYFLLVIPFAASAFCNAPLFTGNSNLDQQAQTMYMRCVDNEQQMKAQQERMDAIQQQQLIRQRQMEGQMRE